MATVQVITGASGGMGAACVERLASRGPLVCVDVHAPSDPGPHRWVTGDLRDAAVSAEIAAAVRELGSLGGVAHTAGLSPECGDARAIVDVDLVATARLLAELDPLVGEGTVFVLVASQAGHLLGGDDHPSVPVLDDPLVDDFWDRLDEAGPEIGSDPAAAYAHCKRANHRQVVALAPSWGQRGGRIVSLSPGIIDTPMGQRELATQDAMPWMIEQTPLGRMGTADEIAAVIAFLCSDDASFVTGVDWLVDGGSTAQVQRQIAAMTS